MQGDSRLFRQPARGCLAGVAHHHPKHDPPLSTGRGPARLHAPVRRGEAGGVLRSSVRATDLPEHGGGWVQERPGGPERHDTARPAVRSADRVHAHHQGSLGELPARLSRGCLLHGQESETHTAIGAGAVSGNLRVWLVGRGAGGGASDWRGSRQVPESARGAGRRRAGAVHRRRVSVVHPRHSPHGGGIAPHEPGLPPSSDPGHAMTALLQQWVTEQAERRPDATAVVMDGARMTYEELEASSNRLARTLKAAGCQQGDRVALLLAKSPLAIVSMVGTLKADCTYVPLDASSPAPRVAKIVESAEPRVILAEARAASLLSTLLSNARLRRSTAVGWMDRDRTRGEAFTPSFSLEDVERAPGDPLDYRNGPAHPAHILFRSEE